MIRRSYFFTKTDFFSAMYIWLFMLLSANVHAQIPSASLTKQQSIFLEAYDSLAINDRKAIAQYKRQLHSHPLSIYLDYHDYRIHIKNTHNARIKAFIRNHKNSYLSDKLYVHWLKSLAQKKHWTTYIQNYKPQKSSQLQCYYIQALSNRGQQTKAIKLAQPIWQNSLTFSKACKPIETLLTQRKKITGYMIWQRIKLTMNKKHITTAKSLSKRLSKQQRQMFNYWLKVYKEPQLITKPLPKFISPAVKKMIFTQAVSLLAAKEASLALEALKKYHKTYRLNFDQYAVLKRKIALRTAYKYAPKAEKFLNEVNSTAAKSESSLRWQAQIALRESNWANLLDTIELMPKSMQSKKQWQYWKAKALESTGHKNDLKAAQDICKRLARQRNYYAFLAADKLNLNYQFNPNPIKQKNTQYLIKKYPELKRIQELLAIDWTISAKREWHHLLNRVNRNELQAIALIAHQWEQHNQAIRSLAKAKQWDAIELRFPVAHKGPVMQNADSNNIDPAWIYGIIRRESAFSKDVKSSVGAVGLMQLMPKTAKYIGKKIGHKHTSQKDLIKAENNIALGAAYLSYLADKYNGHMVMATAAYNAGPSRVDRWSSQSGNLPADQWIDSIPFTETRNYVKAVLEYTTIFKSLLNKRHDRLEDIMPAISLHQVKKTDPKHP